VPEGTLNEVRFLNFLHKGKLNEAYWQLCNQVQPINVNTIIDKQSLFSHTISAFSIAKPQSQEIFIAMIWLMIKHNADLNEYDSNYKTTLFARLCGCNINEEFLALLLSTGVWVNPEVKLPHLPFIKTPLSELATTFDASLVSILCQAGANPNPVVFHTKTWNGNIINNVITIAAENGYFETDSSTEKVSEILLALVLYQAEINDDNIIFLTLKFNQYPNNSALYNLVETLKNYCQSQLNLSLATS
jgi:hypothetical protein